MDFCKKIIYLIFVIFVLFSFLFVCYGRETEVFADTMTGWSVLYQKQYNNQAGFIGQCYAIGKENQRLMYGLNRFKAWVATMGHNGRSIVVLRNTSGYQFALFHIDRDGLDSYLGNVNSITDEGYTVMNAEAYINVPCTLILGIYSDGGTNYVIDADPVSVNLIICTAELEIFHPSFIDLFKDFGVTSSSDDELLNIMGTISQNTSVNYSNSLDTMNSTLIRTEEKIDNIDNTLNDDSIDVDTSIGLLPTDVVPDITEGGFNSIFDLFYSAFTSGEGQSLVINLPFVNKSFIISFQTVFGGFPNISTITSLAHMFWYYFICCYIVLDIGKRYDKIKSGDIENVVNSNIKEDLL